MNLAEQVAVVLQRAAETTKLDLQRDTFVVGVSGGPDSSVLLHLLAQLIPPEHLVVAHLDHGLRPTSAAEARTVSMAAGNLRFHTERIDVAGKAKGEGISLEEAGRVSRYDFLARVAQLEGASAVAVGHNADDQAETVLMHFLRGTGLAGLRGMGAVSPLPGRDGLWLLRPLLTITRAEIESYCAENSLAPLIDESNSDPAFLRNRLRHELLPALETYNPQIRRRLRETADILSADEDLLSEISTLVWRDVVVGQAQGRIVMQRSAWQALPLALRRRLLRLAVCELRPELRDVGFRTLESARMVGEKGNTGSRAMLPGGIVLLVSYESLIITAQSPNLTIPFPQLATAESLPLPIPGTLELDNGWWLIAHSVETFDLAAIEANADSWTAYVAHDPSAALFVRPRLRGERIRPLGMSGERKIKDVMIDRKIPGAARARWPIVATGDHTVWIAGHVLDERSRVRADSRRVVCLRYVRPDEAEADEAEAG